MNVTKCKSGTASGLKHQRVGVDMASPRDHADVRQHARNAKFRTIVRWGYTPNKVTLVKVGPRQPTLAMKLAELKEKFS